MPAKKKPTKSLVDKQKDNQARVAQRLMLQELFNELYLDRARVFKMNFVRGITFGLGSAIGGTIGLAIVLGLTVWILNLFDGLPLIGDWLGGFSEDISQQ